MLGLPTFNPISPLVGNHPFDEVKPELEKAFLSGWQGHILAQVLPQQDPAAVEPGLE